MYTDSFLVHVKTKDIYKDIAEDVETRFDTSNFEIDRPLPNGKKIIRQTMKKIVEFIEKTCSYLNDNNDEDRKAKSTKTCVMKRKLKFEDCKNCLQPAQIERKINYLEEKKIDVDSLEQDKNKFVKK